MAGWQDIVSGVVGGLGDSAVKIRTAITGVSPDAQAKLTELAANLEAQARKAETDLLAAQIDVNKAEASSTKMFVAGARPFILWVCGAAFAWNYVIRPAASAMFPSTPFPTLDLGEMVPVMTGMLGLGAYRTYEKIKGVAGSH